MTDDFRERFKAAAAKGVEITNDPTYLARIEDVERRIAILEQREKAFYRKAGLLRSRVPESTWHFLDAPKSTDAMQAVQLFLASDERFVTLAGPLGRGKTVGLSWLVSREGGRYYLAQEVVQTSSFDRKLWEELTAVPILALDDLGSEKGNDEFDANLYALLDGRYRRNRKTAIGTNLTASQFRARYTVGPMARLYERLQTGGRWVNLPGESMRRVAP